ncbi:DUF4149 domain-containing protein [Rhodoferax lacus]|uniref:DUF4149 domain-containing protein n=1 Tax=Rhodoferax lacus TaxID=2184758 RepID=A0A3E1RC62_9BURK|nr:DUF4149 domain-containing protein [Rhodoferax lacus]RFO96954.1 DUF4149 domain-containing protein [Rhodoferax lacus]
MADSSVWRSLPLWLAAAWAMSLTTLGFFVVPMLFANLPNPAMAGGMAAKLFAAQTGVSAVCALLLLMCFRSEKLAPSARVIPACTLLALAGALLALLVEFGVSPRIVARDNLALWHGVGTAMYFGQWACALLVFGKLANAASAQPASAPL